MKIFLGVAGVLALVGICFACLSIYAKKEINKPRYEFNSIMTQEPLRLLPNNKDDAFDYVNEVFEKAVVSDEVEMTRHTDVHLTEGDTISQFSPSDKAILSRVFEKAQGAFGELYPSGENALMSVTEEKPVLGFTKEDVKSSAASLGYQNEDKVFVDDGNYYITLDIFPESVDTASLLKGEIRKTVENELSSVLKVSSLEIVPREITATFKISYYNDKMISAEFKRSFRIIADVDFTQDYSALSAETAHIEFPYETVESIDFFNYGIHFSEREFAIQKGDIQALPLEVNVNSETTKDDYKLTFETSKDGILKIDEDGVMEALDASPDPVTVMAKLEYNGHTYTDELIVYATDLEVKTDEQEG